MPSLDRAFAFAQMDHVSVFIGQHLYLNVSRPLDISFDINRAVLKRVQRLGLGEFQIAVKFAFLTHNTHSASAAAGRCLDDQRKTDLESDLSCFFGRFDRVGAAGQDRHAGRRHCTSCLDLVAHHGDHIRPRTDEFDIAVFADLGKSRRFSQKTITGMDSVDVCDLGRTDDRRDVQVALG